MSSTLAEDHGPVPNRGPAVFAVTTATLALATIFVGARIACRYFIVRRLSWDDMIMAVAWVVAFFLSFSIDYGTTVGLGKHDANIDQADWSKLRRAEYVFSILYNPALMATKTSILVFYLRLAKNTQIVLRYVSWATLAVVNIAGIVLTFMNVFQCHPVSAAWKAKPQTAAVCIPLLTEFICAAPVNIVTDLVILALPIPVLTGMRLPVRQKAILVITFSVGIFVTVVDVVRIYYLQKAISEVPTGASTDPEAIFGGNTDFAWNASLSFMWSAVEVNIAMACACIPTLKPLFLKLLPAILYDPDGTRISRMSKTVTDPDSPPTRVFPSAVRDSVSMTAPDGNGEGHDAGGKEICAAPDGVGEGHNAGAEEKWTETNPSGALQFLTTPDMSDLRDGAAPQLSVATRAQTHGTASSDSVENGIYFGFVNMTKPKSMLRTNASESLKYCTVVAILFFLWGISYGLLNTLNNAIGAVNEMSDAQTLGLTSAYFGGGYLFGPLLVGEWTLRRDEHNRSKRHGRSNNENVGGYKVTFIVGLSIYGIGTIVFWPSAVTDSYGGFMLSNFIVGFGLSVLEVAANSFMVLCGPQEYGETRLLLAQAVQAVGSVVSGALAQKVFFVGLSQENTSQATSMTLINVQWTYLGITLLCVALGLFFFYMPLPEVTDRELEVAASRLPLDGRKPSIGGFQLRTITLVMAVFAQYVYVAGQESNSIYFSKLITSVLLGSQTATGTDAVSGASSPGSIGDTDKPPGLSIPIPDYLLIGHTAFALSRLLAACVTYFSVSNRRLPQPRTLLAFHMSLCFLFSLLAAVLRPPKGELLVIPIILYFFAEGPIWPLVFAIGLRGQGRRTKRAAAFITMGGSGPAFFPFIMYGAIRHGASVQTAYFVIIALQLAMLIYPFGLGISRGAKLLVDPKLKARTTLRHEEDTARPPDGGRQPLREKTSGFLEKISKGIGAKLGGRRRSSQAYVEHDETAAPRPH